MRGRLGGVRSPDDPEVARPQPLARRAEEEGSVALGADEAAQVVLERR